MSGGQQGGEENPRKTLLPMTAIVKSLWPCEETYG